jgi:hypothetical protein
MVRTSLGIDVLRLGILLPVTYSLSFLSCGFASLLSTLAHATSGGRIITHRIAFFIGQPPCSNGLIVLAEGITECWAGVLANFALMPFAAGVLLLIGAVITF